MKNLLRSSNKVSFFLYGAIFFCVTLFLIIAFQFDFLKKMPGDLGDARLNNYFLENIYQYFIGNSPSLIHLSFFYPFPYVLGMSDNLFGSAPIYLFARLFAPPETSFQIWYLFGYFANYTATYLALRQLKIGVWGAIFGAIVFSFGLPANAQIGHAQLQFRFGVPLAFSSFLCFLESKNWKYFCISGIWVVWQFYCSIYIGTFLLVFLFSLLILYFIKNKREQKNVLDSLREFGEQFLFYPRKKQFFYICVLLILTILMGFLFYPYIQAVNFYHFKRSLFGIAAILPKIQSYFLADISKIWSVNLSVFDIYARHEQQMFFGAIPLIFVACSVFMHQKKNNEYFLISRAFLYLFLITLSFFYFSIWLLFANLPIINSIRVVARICLIMLFPVAYLGACGFELVIDKFKKSDILKYCMLLVLIYECSAVDLSMSEKSAWLERVQNAESLLPKSLPDNPILFYAQSKHEPAFISELDAMWVGLKNNLPTLNGYSGNFPPIIEFEFGQNCQELPIRILSYLLTVNQVPTEVDYLSLMKRVVPIGFQNCNLDWWNHLVKYTIVEENKQCERTYQKILDKLRLSQNSKYVEMIHTVILLANRFGVSECVINRKITIQ